MKTIYLTPKKEQSTVKFYIGGEFFFNSSWRGERKLGSVVPAHGCALSTNCKRARSITKRYFLCHFVRNKAETAILTEHLTRL